MCPVGKPPLDVGQIALRLLRLEEEIRAFRELHEQELQPIEMRIMELRAELAHFVHRGSAHDAELEDVNQESYDRAEA